MTELPLEISCQAVKRQLEETSGMFLLDCREEQEHALASISGARLLPMSQLANRVEELAELAGNEERHLVVFCHHGGRSAQVVAWLRQQGFDQAQSMAGGIDCWALDIEPQMPRY